MKQAVAATLLAVWAPAWGADPGSVQQDRDRAWMIEAARGWAEQACGGPWVLTDILADDFQGTSPKGERYGKPAEKPVFGPETVWSSDCQLDRAELRFFGADVAVMYGAESKTVPLPDGKRERRCVAWTDTWLRRDGHWKIIAVQDNRVDCPAAAD